MHPSAWLGALALALGMAVAPASAQDLEREARLAQETQTTLVVGDPIWLEQKSGHRVLALYAKADKPRGAVVLVHGRGWSPDYDLYGDLRIRLADAGYSTLSVQMPVLAGTAKLGDYLETFPDADERIGLAVAWLHAQGAANVSIVSHSLGATMANYYLIHTANPPVDAWVMVSIINGLEDMFRIKVPVLDVFGTADWDVTRYGADERKAQIARIPRSQQVVLTGAQHFYEGQREELARVVVAFLDRVYEAKRGTR
jgi:pimeloyl-ACP methyl ester carboxylesterase